MSRFGQCFTQSKVEKSASWQNKWYLIQGVDIAIQEFDYETVADFIGGCDGNDESYTFS